MMGLGPAIIAIVVVGLPILVVGYLFHRWFQLKEKKLEVEGRLAVEKAAQYAASNASWRRASECSSKSSPTPARRPPTRSKPCATSRGSPVEMKPDEPV